MIQQPQEPAIPQMPVLGPFQELDPRHQHRPDPSAVLHFIRLESLGLFTAPHCHISMIAPPATYRHTFWMSTARQNALESCALGRIIARPINQQWRKSWHTE